MSETTSLVQDVEYLDLDGDGVPDAVLIRETLTADAPEGPRPIETIETLETGIDIDGVPHHIEVHADAA
ncbi:MAG: hypothetical protein U0W40_00240 [Acidimicrobiia bacterium]